jgi:drug/metabolite transporter (DMT)-like permease
MLIGVLFALLAGLMWGLIFVAPSWWTAIPALLASGRYLAFGLIVLPLAWQARKHWRPSRPATGERPSPSLWWGTSSLLLPVGGHLAHRLAPGGHVYRHPAGGDGPGCQPPLWRTGRSPLPHPALPVPGADGAGLCLVNSAELTWHTEARTEQLLGLALAVGAVLCWTWYPLRNARRLREHPGRSPAVWATAQGLVTLPVALIAYLGSLGHLALSAPDFPLPFGPTPCASCC